MSIGKQKYSIIPAKALDDTRLKLIHYLVIMSFGCNINKVGVVFKTQETVLNDLGGRYTNKMTVLRAIKDLIKWQYICKLEYKDTGVKRKSRWYTNRYLVIFGRDGVPEIPKHEELELQHLTVAETRIHPSVLKETRELQQGETQAPTPDTTALCRILTEGTAQSVGQVPSYSNRELQSILEAQGELDWTCTREEVIEGVRLFLTETLPKRQPKLREIINYVNRIRSR